jgi:hypothetical protein
MYKTHVACSWHSTSMSETCGVPVTHHRYQISLTRHQWPVKSTPLRMVFPRTSRIFSTSARSSLHCRDRDRGVRGRSPPLPVGHTGFSQQWREARGAGKLGRELGLHVVSLVLSEKMMWCINDMITLKWGRILLPGLKYK